MIPSPIALKHEASEAWARYRNEDVFRMWVESTWTPRIHAAYGTGEINMEGLRLAFDAVLSPIPYRRRFGRFVRMSRDEAIAELIDCGEDVSDLTDEELLVVAREFGIVIVDQLEHEEATP